MSHLHVSGRQTSSLLSNGVEDDRGVLGRRLLPDEVAGIDDREAAVGQSLVEKLSVDERDDWIVAAVDYRDRSRKLRQQLCGRSSAFRRSLAPVNLPGQVPEPAWVHVSPSSRSSVVVMGASDFVVVRQTLAPGELRHTTRTQWLMAGPADPASRTIVFGTGFLGRWVVARKGWRLEVTNEPGSGSRSEAPRTQK
jgi:hypothetical protein